MKFYEGNRKHIVLEDSSFKEEDEIFESEYRELLTDNSLWPKKGSDMKPCVGKFVFHGGKLWKWNYDENILFRVKKAEGLNFEQEFEYFSLPVRRL